ncbi:IPT/TIG domain-containing protein [Actinoplanes sp. NPDC051513]|uniref:IPT/TIG domain-containing protein n=1 Tax=Actinoplanes sp. NPDC051513 TaxID=3363908 RepID=UPI0037B94AC7
MVGAVGAALLVAPQAAYAGVGNIGPMIVMPGTNANIFDQSSPFTTTTPVVQISTAPCAASKVTSVPLPSGVWNATGATRTIDGNLTTNTVQFTVPSTSGPTTGANYAIRAYNACVYDSVTGAAQSSAPFYVGAQAMANPMAGATGAGGQITITTPANAPLFAATPGALFTTGTCAGTYGTPGTSNLVATGVTRQTSTSVSLNVPPGAVGSTPNATNYNVCLYENTGSGALLLSIANYNVYSVTLSPAGGSYLASNGITGSSTQPFLSGVAAPGVLVVPGGGCPGNVNQTSGFNPAPVPVSAPYVRKLTNYRLAVTIPPLTQQTPNANQPLFYSICFFSNSTTGSLVGSGSYAATVVANPTGVIPSAGPANGGTVITVVGTDFPTEPGRITATLGGVPLTDIQPQGDKMFTARTPAHAVEDNVSLVVTTPAGTKALQNAFSFVNPVKVTPNTAPNTTPTLDVDVQGIGFLGMNFGTGGNSARVFLVRGVYNGADAGGGARANGPVTECTNVLPISDEELICNLQLNRRLDATGASFNPVSVNRSLASDIGTTAGSRVITSVGGKFIPDDVGQMIVEDTSPAHIPASTTITSVLGPTRAVISAPASQAGSTLTAVIGGPAVHSFSNAVITTADSTTVSLASGAAFTSADVGRVFSGTTGIPTGTTIVAVAPGGASATLSAPASSPNPNVVTATVTTSNNSANITYASGALAAADQNGVIGPNTIGIPVGTTITTVTGSPSTAGVLSANATSALGTVGSGTITINRAVSGSLFPASPVPSGSYNLTVVSNGALDAQTTDPDYFQTAVTSSSVFTVGPF